MKKSKNRCQAFLVAIQIQTEAINNLNLRSSQTLRTLRNGWQGTFRTLTWKHPNPHLKIKPCLLPKTMFQNRLNKQPRTILGWWNRSKTYKTSNSSTEQGPWVPLAISDKTSFWIRSYRLIRLQLRPTIIFLSLNKLWPISQVKIRAYHLQECANQSN